MSRFLRSVNQPKQRIGTGGQSHTIHHALPSLASQCKPNKCEDIGEPRGRLSRNMLYVDGQSKLANPLVSLTVVSYT